MCLLCRGLRWYFDTTEYNKRVTRIPTKRIIICCILTRNDIIRLLPYILNMYVYWCWWENSWEQEDPLYIFHNICSPYIWKNKLFIYFKMCPGRCSIYMYRKCWWVPLSPPPYWFQGIHLQLQSTKQYTCTRDIYWWGCALAHQKRGVLGAGTPPKRGS